MTDDDLADGLSSQHQHPSPTGKVGQCECPTCPDLRAAAAELRRLRDRDAALTRLLDAAGDADNLRLLADTFDLPYLRRIAAAVEGIEQEHER